MTGEFVKERLKSEGYILDEIAFKMGISPQNLQSKLKTNDIKVGVLQSIAKAINKNVYFFFDDNVSNGSLAIASSTMFKLRTDNLVLDQMIPLYESFVKAGLTPVFEDFQTQEPIDHLYIPKAPQCDGAIYATGDSMYPLIKSGDIIAFKTIQDFLNDVYWGNIYILYLEVAGDLFRVIKYVQKGQTPEFLKLVSHNKNHEDQEVSISKVKAMAQVKITARIN